MIKKWNQYSLNERFGVAKESLIFKDALADIIWEELEDFLENNPRKLLIKKLHITWDMLKPHVPSNYRELWSRYPVREFNVKLRLDKDSAYTKDIPEDKTAVTGGAMHHVSKRQNSKLFSHIIEPIHPFKDKSLSVRLEVKIATTSEFDIDGDDGIELMTELKSTISHELNHGYEYFKRIGFEKNLAKGMDTFVGVVNVKNPNPSLISEKLFDKWVEFTYLLYYSEPHEVNAMSQETWEYVNGSDIDLDDASGYEAFIRTTPAWDHANDLTSFDHEAYNKELLELADGDESKLQLLKDSFIARWKKDMEHENKLTKEGKYKTKYNMEYLTRSNMWAFTKYFKKRIADQGKRLKRNLHRLIMLKHTDEDIFFYKEK